MNRIGIESNIRVFLILSLLGIIIISNTPNALGLWFIFLVSTIMRWEE